MINRDPSDDGSPIDPTTITPHDTYLEDGNAEVLCGNTLFRVHTSVLSFHSPALCRMFTQNSLVVTRSAAEPCCTSPLTTSVIVGSADDVQQLFLQALMSRRVVTRALARILLRRCVKAVKGPSSHPICSGWEIMESRSRKRGLGYPDPGSQITTACSTCLRSISMCLLDKLDLEIVPFVDGLTGNQVYISVRPRAELRNTCSPWRSEKCHNSPHICANPAESPYHRRTLMWGRPSNSVVSWSRWLSGKGVLVAAQVFVSSRVG